MKQYLKSLWLTETVRLIEKEKGRFQDDEANRQARVLQGQFADRIIKRALVISEQNGLQTAQNYWLHGARISLIILFIIAVFSGVGLGISALAQNPINLYWALLCLLGVHFVTLFFWIMCCLFLPSESGSLFIQLWRWLTDKFSRQTTISQLLPAFVSLFGNNIRWLIGLVVNLLWSIILFSALIILLALLSTKHYSFEWQTTLLTTDTVVDITHYLGKIPALLGFPLPNSEMIRSSEYPLSDSDIRSAWAIWLLGVFIVYGFVIRLMLFIFCWFKWMMARQNLTLNIHYPEYQLLRDELEFSHDKSIIDPDNVNHNSAINVTEITHNHLDVKKNWLVAIEMDEQWAVPAEVNFLGFLNNGEQQRSKLDYLQQYPAEKLLIAIDTDRAPDRGILNLITLLMGKSQQVRLWFVTQGRQYDNWIESAKKIHLEQGSISWLI